MMNKMNCVLASLTCLLLCACSATPSGIAGASSNPLSDTGATANISAAITELPTPVPTPEPVLATDFGSETLPLSDDYRLLVYAVKGTLDGRDIVLFLTQGSLQYDGKSWYCVFNDAFTGKPLLKRKSASATEFDASTTSGDIIPLEYLPGIFNSDNRILHLNDYLMQYHHFAEDQVNAMMASGELWSFEHLLQLYKDNVTETQWYIAPRTEMRGIDDNTYVEAYTVDGQEKLLIVQHYAWKIQAMTTLYSVDVITGQKLYDENEPQSNWLTPAKPASLIPFAEYFNDIPYERACTKDELITLYKAHIPGEKQYLLPDQQRDDPKTDAPNALAPTTTSNSQTGGISTIYDKFPVSLDYSQVLQLRIAYDDANEDKYPAPIIVFVNPTIDVNAKGPYQHPVYDVFSGNCIGYIDYDSDELSLIGSDFLPGTFIINKKDYILSYFGEHVLQDIKNHKDLREFYVKNIPDASQCVIPQYINIRRIQKDDYAETITVDGVEKILFVTHTEDERMIEIVAEGKELPFRDLGSSDIISGQMVYSLCYQVGGENYMTKARENMLFYYSEGIVEYRMLPKDPPDLIPMSKFLKDVKDVPYDTPITVEELIALYKAHVPEDKQLLLTIPE